MAWEEAKRWARGEKHSSYYQKQLEATKEQAQKRQQQPQVIKPQEMPWEDSPQGRIKHLINTEMDVPFHSVDAYIQELPPGSRSGKHRHMAEEYLFILEGKGYDLHWDADFELSEDGYQWHFAEEPKRFDWEIGDSVYIPANTIHQHFNADPTKPARFISARARAYAQSGFGEVEQIEKAPGYE